MFVYMSNLGKESAPPTEQGVDAKQIVHSRFLKYFNDSGYKFEMPVPNEAYDASEIKEGQHTSNLAFLKRLQTKVITYRQQLEKQKKEDTIPSVTVLRSLVLQEGGVEELNRLDTILFRAETHERYTQLWSRCVPEQQAAFPGKEKAVWETIVFPILIHGFVDFGDSVLLSQRERELISDFGLHAQIDEETGKLKYPGGLSEDQKITLRFFIQRLTFRAILAGQIFAVDYLNLPAVENTEEGPEVEFLETDSLQAIPPKYRGLPVDDVETVWEIPIYADPEKTKREREKKARAIAALREKERQEAAGVVEAQAQNAHEKNSTNPETSADTEIERGDGSFERRYPTKEISLPPDVVRQSKQEAFGDSNGSLDGVIEHLQNRDLIRFTTNGSVEWLGGTTNAVFVGDILGDRSPEGLEIYDLLYELNEQAVKVGGSVEWLSGNHENMFNSFLAGIPVEPRPGVPGLKEDLFNRLTGYPGIFETAQYLPSTEVSRLLEVIKSKGADAKLEIDRHEQLKKISVRAVRSLNPPDPRLLYASEKKLETIRKYQGVLNEIMSITSDVDIDFQRKLLAKALYLAGDMYLPQSVALTIGQSLLAHRSDIVTNMLETQQGAKRIEALCSQKLVIMKDDVLYVHTNMSKPMTDAILFQVKERGGMKEGVEYLNNLYQGILRSHLTGMPPLDTWGEEKLKYFDYLRNTFLSTSDESRTNYTDSATIDAAEQERITDSFHRYKVNMIIHGHQDEKGQARGSTKLPILSIDRTVYNGIGNNNANGLFTPISHATITTEGKVQYHE